MTKHASNSNLFIAYYKSPIGILEISASNTSIIRLKFCDNDSKKSYQLNEIISACINQLDQYFSLSREIFELPIQPEGSDFQLKVWEELSKIPYGKTITYIEQSLRIGDPKAIRAVAKANSQNKIPIIIPCHRVIGADGSLVGYGGGLWRKKWLLEHETKKFGEQISLGL